MEEQHEQKRVISTHSLTRRLTVLQMGTTLQQANFNSQPHKEADLHLPFFTPPLSSFQLTASQGG